MNETKNNPKYYYRRNKGLYRLYEDQLDFSSKEIDNDWNEEVIREKCYKLNGWKYKPKSKY